MVSPTQLCWRYHSLPLRQRIITMLSSIHVFPAVYGLTQWGPPYSVFDFVTCFWLPAWWALRLPWWPPAECSNVSMLCAFLVFTKCFLFLYHCCILSEIKLTTTTTRPSDAYMHWWTTSHYLNQCWNIVNWTLSNKLQWNFNRNSNIFIQENALENVVCKKTSILTSPQCIKMNTQVKYTW